MSEAWDDLVLVGRIARTHGHRGAVIVTPDTDFPEERFATGAIVWMRRAGVPVAVKILRRLVPSGPPRADARGHRLDERRGGDSGRGTARARRRAAAAARGRLLSLPARGLRGGDDGRATRSGRCEPSTGRPAITGLSVTGPEGEVLVPLVTPICVAIDLAGAPGGDRPARRAAGGEPQGRRRRGPMKFDIVTIFPRMFDAPLREGVVARGIEAGVVDVAVHDLRDFTTDRHRVVDDVPVRWRAGDGDEARAVRAGRRAHPGRARRRRRRCC